MDKRKLTISEIEEMEYYDFMSYIGVPYFNIGGPLSTEELAGLCHINKSSIVLMVGCGSGFSACHLAKTMGCFVLGVDIASLPVEHARQRAVEENIENLTDFITGDAYNLPFMGNSFDIVITEFVSQFLDKKRAFTEFRRVLKAGGYAGINELYRDDNIEPYLKAKIDKAETIFTEVTGLPFSMETPGAWQHYFEKTEFTDIRIHQHKPFQGFKDMFVTFKAMGGFLNTAGIMLKMLIFAISSKKIRRSFSKLDKGKRAL
ncbi:class I SAM-dependent methyltransferase [Methanolobus sp. ZRKC5]|uniref:class I SAM-dependent methyltransferase n=1 Tax=unclassified Methanolobus TaxID=2629569 RepID=UPI00313DA102